MHAYHICLAYHVQAIRFPIILPNDIEKEVGDGDGGDGGAWRRVELRLCFDYCLCKGCDGETCVFVRGESWDPAHTVEV